VLRLLEQNAPLVQRTNGVVVPPAGSASGAGGPVRGALRGALSGASRTARERPSRRPVSRAAPTVPRSLRGRARRYSSRSSPWGREC